MNAHLKLLGIAAAVMLVGCATSTRPDTKLAATTDHNVVCPTKTGSRIPPNGTDCSAPGRAYSSQDIDRTGQADTAEALRLLDPAVTIKH
jgi:hypothetical protein